MQSICDQYSDCGSCKTNWSANPSQVCGWVWDLFEKNKGKCIANQPEISCTHNIPLGWMLFGILLIFLILLVIHILLKYFCKKRRISYISINTFNDFSGDL